MSEFTPISKLYPSIPSFHVLVKVVNIQPIKQVTQKGGKQLKILTMTLADAEGNEIQCNAYNQTVDALLKKLQKGLTYEIQSGPKCSIKVNTYSK